MREFAEIAIRYTPKGWKLLQVDDDKIVLTLGKDVKIITLDQAKEMLREEAEAKATERVRRKAQAYKGWEWIKRHWIPITIVISLALIALGVWIALA